jgi:Fanconi anemia group M protein
MQKVLPSRKVLIFVDSREIFSNVVSELATYDCIIRDKLLTCGDYLCSDRVCIERKTSEDFVSSVVDQRLFKQLNELKESFEKPILLIEGNKFYNRNIHPNAIRGALVSIALDFGIPILWSDSPKESAALIYAIARREQISYKREIILRTKKKSQEIKEVQEFLVAGLPSINTKLAKRLLEHFKTPKKVFCASEKELQKIEGIGRKKAKRIWKVLNEEYK